MNYRIVKVYLINGKLVVAKNIEEAIEVYASWAKGNEITSVKAVPCDFAVKTYDAIIKDEKA